MYRFPWYLTLVSANHASSSPGQADNKNKVALLLGDCSFDFIFTGLVRVFTFWHEVEVECCLPTSMMDEKAERAGGGDQSVAISHPRKGSKRNENSKVGLKYMRSSLKYDAAI